MPYNKRKQKCKQSDGTPGSYVLSYTTKKGEKRRACHTSKKKMQGQIAAIEAEADESSEETLEETLRTYVREILQEKKRKGLWANIHAKKKRGEKSNPRSKSYQDAKKAGQRINRSKKEVDETDDVEEGSCSEALQYHLRSKKGLDENIFRPGSDSFFSLFREARKRYNSGNYTPINLTEEELLRDTQIGEFGIYEGNRVPLDFPMLISLDEAKYKGREVTLGKKGATRTGGGRGRVYVKNDKGNVVKVEFGSPMSDAMGDSEKDKKRRKNYGDRHNCADKKDKTKPGYWSCRATKLFGRNIPGWW